MLPYAIIFTVVWVALFMAFYLLGIPWGPGKRKTALLHGFVTPTCALAARAAGRLRARIRSPRGGRRCPHIAVSEVRRSS